MEQTFGDQLKQFAMTIDLVDEQVCDRVKRRVEQYFDDTPEIDFYHVMVDGVLVDNRPGLHTAETPKAWCNDHPDSVAIHGPGNTYRAQSTYAYEQREKLWVTAKVDEDGPTRAPDEYPTLNQATAYKDHWFKIDDLPEYHAPKLKENVRTSAIVPLKCGERVFGFLCVESNKYIERKKSSQDELEKIADAIAIILWLYEANKLQHESTQTAFDEFEALDLSTSEWSKPTVFIGASSNADNEVVGYIREVLDKYGDDVREVYWADMARPGDIMEDIVKKILECQVGICYLSEFANVGDQGSKFIDNPNVLFEAGMLHALTKLPASTPKAWIAIREPYPWDPPFDISGVRMIKVPRLADGAKVNAQSFKVELDSMLRTVLGLPSTSNAG